MSASDREAQTTPSPRPRLLVVDDEPNILSALARLLTDYQVSVASDGEVAGQLLATKHFDVVLSDVNMPGVNGLEMLRRARAHDLDMPVVLMTGGPTLETAVEAMRFGALQYLTKPVDLDELLEVLDRAVKLGRLSAARRQAFELLGHSSALEGARAAQTALLDRALAAVRMAYQPIVSWSRRAVVGYEALLRFSDPLLPAPEHVIEAAERLGRVSELGGQIRQCVADDMTANPPSVDILVNLHPDDLQDESLYDEGRALSCFAGKVVLEITERASLAGITDLRERTRRLRQMGFRLAVDDLGAGYAGLTSFALLEPELIKIDMSLVRDVGHSATKQRLIASMASVCKDLGITVLAEGVETAEERDAVVEAGCNQLQGYLFARPLPPFTRLSL